MFYKYNETRRNQSLCREQKSFYLLKINYKCKISKYFQAVQKLHNNSQYL